MPSQVREKTKKFTFKHLLEVEMLVQSEQPNNKCHPEWSSCPPSVASPVIVLLIQHVTDVCQLCCYLLRIKNIRQEHKMD